MNEWMKRNHSMIGLIPFFALFFYSLSLWSYNNPEKGQQSGAERPNGAVHFMVVGFFPLPFSFSLLDSLREELRVNKVKYFRAIQASIRKKKEKKKTRKQVWDSYRSNCNARSWPTFKVKVFHSELSRVGWMECEAALTRHDTTHRYAAIQY